MIRTQTVTHIDRERDRASRDASVGSSDIFVITIILVLVLFSFPINHFDIISPYRMIQ